jgi:hypothetical protein
MTPAPADRAANSAADDFTLSLAGAGNAYQFLHRCADQLRQLLPGETLAIISHIRRISGWITGGIRLVAAAL